MVDKITQLPRSSRYALSSVPPSDGTCHGAVRHRTHQRQRQLKHDREIIAHNKGVEETGISELQERRTLRKTAPPSLSRFQRADLGRTDLSQEIYHYHFVNAEGPIDEVEKNILRELQYQSSLELDPRTYDRLSNLPLAGI